MSLTGTGTSSSMPGRTGGAAPASTLAGLARPVRGGRAALPEAAELFEEYDNRFNLADGLDHLAECAQAAGDRTAAVAAWQRAAEVLTELGMSADDVNRKLAAVGAG